MFISHSPIVAVSALITLVVGSSAAEMSRDEISGTWELVSAEAHGGTPTIQQLGRSLSFADGKVLWRDEKGIEGIADFSYQVDSTKEPKELDFIRTKGTATITMRGVYKIEKNQLTICFGDIGPFSGPELVSKRPKDFGPALGKVILILRRERKGEETQDKEDSGRGRPN